MTQSEHTPHVEGVNMGTYVGFKHVAYTLQAGVYAHLRRNGMGARVLYDEFGVHFELTGMDVTLRSGMLLDDAVYVTVEPCHDEESRSLRFRCLASVVRESGRVVVATGELSGQLTRLSNDPRFTDRRKPEPLLGAWIHEDIPMVDAEHPIPVRGREHLGVTWTQRLGYVYGHYFGPLYVDAYLRILEDAKDRFMVEIGCPLEQLAATEGLVPMVTRFNLHLESIANMGVSATIDYHVTNIIKRLLYDAAFQAWELLGDGMGRPLVTGSIQHGYAWLHNGRRASLTDLPTPLLSKFGVAW